MWVVSQTGVMKERNPYDPQYHSIPSWNTLALALVKRFHSVIVVCGTLVFEEHEKFHQRR